MKFYNAIKSKYPDIKLITNCDSNGKALDHPADYYDFHIYDTAAKIFQMKDNFNNAIRSGPKAFVSEYAVHHDDNKKNQPDDAGKGSFLASLAESAFLIGLEKNSDVVGMASYAPLFVNANNRGWSPDAIVFDSSQVYGTPSYWMQHFFKNSSGAMLNPTSMQPDISQSIIASAITYDNSDDNKSYLKIKVVNFGDNTVNMKITLTGLQYSINALGSSKTIMIADNLMDENSFSNPTKVVPRKSPLIDASTNMDVQILPRSITSYDLQLDEPVSEPDTLHKKTRKENSRDV